MFNSVILDAVEAQMDEFLLIPGIAKTGQILENRIKWLYGVKTMFLLSAISSPEEVAEHWKELLTYEDTGIQDFVVEGAGALYLAVWEEVKHHPDRNIANVWDDVIADIAVAVTICRSGSVATTDKDFQERGLDGESMRAILRENPWLLVMFAISKLPISRMTQVRAFFEQGAKPPAKGAASE